MQDKGIVSRCSPSDCLHIVFLGDNGARTEAIYLALQADFPMRFTRRGRALWLPVRTGISNGPT